MSWTDEQREEAKELYENANPTAETSTEIVKDIAETIGQSPNGTRMILIKQGVYIKATGNKTPAKTGGAASGGDKPKRMSKADSAAALIAALKAQAIELEAEELAAIDRATGKMTALIKKWVDTMAGDEEDE